MRLPIVISILSVLAQVGSVYASDSDELSKKIDQHLPQFDCVIFRYAGGRDASMLLNGNFKNVFEATTRAYNETLDVLAPEIRTLEKSRSLDHGAQAVTQSLGRRFWEKLEKVQETEGSADYVLGLQFKIREDCKLYEKARGKKRLAIEKRINKNFWKFRAATNYETKKPLDGGDVIDFSSWSRQVSQLHQDALDYREALDNPLKKVVVTLLSGGDREDEKKIKTMADHRAISNALKILGNPTRTLETLFVSEEKSAQPAK